MKPIEVITWAIQQTKQPCNTVCDLFGGSGTTLIACEQLNKQSYIMELDPKYVDVIIDRYIKFKGGNDADVFLLNKDGSKVPYKQVKTMRKNK